MTNLDAWTVGHFKAEDIPDKDRALITSLIEMSRLMKDGTGKPVPFVLPPAMAAAIVAVMRFPFPEGAARHLVSEFTPKPVVKKPPARKAAAPRAKAKR